MTTQVLFGAPHNWCDSRCRRCALHNDCKAAITMDCRSQRHREARERGHYMLAVVPAVDDMLLDRSVLAASLERANLQLTRCVFKLEIAGVLDRERAAECLRLCLLLVSKSARVTSYSPRDFTHAPAGDTLPNLLLIELTLTQLHEQIEPLGDPQTRSALREVELLLAPLLERLDDGARAQLAQLVRSGRAPSPFLVTSACAMEHGST